MIRFLIFEHQEILEIEMSNADVMIFYGLRFF